MYNINSIPHESLNIHPICADLTLSPEAAAQALDREGPGQELVMRKDTGHKILNPKPDTPMQNDKP